MQVLGSQYRRFDQGGDLFFDQISALHKSVRGSDPDAALYWFARMLDGGCDPLYVARRVVRMASEDIGNADPRALTIALNAWDVQSRLGQPEGELAIAQAITYLSVAAKSNAVYLAWKNARQRWRTVARLRCLFICETRPLDWLNHLDMVRSIAMRMMSRMGLVQGSDTFPMSWTHCATMSQRIADWNKK